MKHELELPAFAMMDVEEYPDRVWVYQDRKTEKWLTIRDRRNDEIFILATFDQWTLTELAILGTGSMLAAYFKAAKQLLRGGLLGYDLSIDRVLDLAKSKGLNGVIVSKQGSDVRTIYVK